MEFEPCATFGSDNLIFVNQKASLRSSLQQRDINDDVVQLSTNDIQLVAWHRGKRRSLAGELPCPALDLYLTGNHVCGKPSPIGQPTMPTQPFILSGSINE